MGEINWIATLFLGALLSIPFGIVANLLSRPAENWLTQQAITSRSKSITRIKEEYQRAKDLHEDPMKLQLVINKRVVSSFFSILAFIITIFFTLLLYFAYSYRTVLNIPAAQSTLLFGFFSFFIALIAFLTMVHALLGLLLLQSASNDITRAIEFDTYEQQALSELKKLENTLARKNKK